MALSGTLNFSVTVGTETLSWGWTEGTDYGTTADYFVDPASGSDANTGTSVGDAFATVAKALTEVSGAGGSIKITGSPAIVREQVNMVSGVSGTPVEITPYSTDSVIWTGGEQVTGWTQCTSGDEADVGANYANIYKKTVALSSLASSAAINANPFENGTQMTLCVGWAGGDLNDKFFADNSNDFWDADSVATDGSNNILSYTDTSVTGTYTAAQIENALLIGQAEPNIAFVSAISGVSGSVITISDQTNTYENNDKKNRYALLNLLPAMEEGQWGYKDAGGGNVTIYIWPTNAANVTSNIELCARPKCIALSGQDYWTIKGIKFQQVAGSSGQEDGAFIFSSSANYPHTNITLENNYFYGSFCTPRQGSTAAVSIPAMRNSVIRSNTLLRAQNSFGFEINGRVLSPISTTVHTYQTVMEYNSIGYCGQAGLRGYGWRESVVAHNLFHDTSLGTHANAINFYEQSHRVLVWGNIFRDVNGYITWQEASAIYLGFNYKEGTRGSTTTSTLAISDQNDGSTAPPSSYLTGEDADFWVFNNTCTPQPIAITSATNNIRVGSTATPYTMLFNGMNNLSHGFALRDANDEGSIDYNWDTSSAAPRYTNDTDAAPTDVWTDPANGDFTIKTGAAIRSATGQSLESLVDNTLSPIFGSLFSRWTMDATGNTFTLASPPIGCISDYDYTLAVGSRPPVT